MRTASGLRQGSYCDSTRLYVRYIRLQRKHGIHDYSQYTVY